MPVSASDPVAVIDIGSNSVRLVIYDGLKRVPMPLFNEKVLCGLARNMNQTGRLDPEAVDRADKAIGRFISLSHIMQVQTVFLFATAAVRDTRDGTEFVARMEEKYRVKIEVFSGEEEAKYAAMGVVSSISDSKGVVADLGGGSLELVSVTGEKIGKGITLPLGPVRLLAEGSINKADYKKIIDGYLEEFPLVKKLSGKSFYTVGGAFRSLAKVHMDRKAYPLKVIHNYQIPATDFESTLQIVSRMSEAALIKMPYVSSKRLSFLPFAALLASRIIKRGNPKDVVFSAYGVREGLLYSKLLEEERVKDPLIAGCSDIASRTLRSPDYGYELYDWVAPLFKKGEKGDERLRLAACILSDISCYENSEYRAELAYRRVMDSSLTGISHKERVFIAKALYCRYSTRPDEDILAAMQPLLNEKRFAAAQTLGSAMRLARSLSCSHKDVLKKTALSLSKGKLTLSFEEENALLAGEAIEKRLVQLATVMGKDAEIKAG